ncbi:MAG TPA: zinc ribbon domain-containing protein [Gemmatimonadales bacterium]|jgi:putative FmdB family regulatory protein|nr:zinc ribbon domain-containing protein [Gemmatimonadales bacterium]
MPTYEFKCPAGHRFEKFYPTMNDRQRVKCPTCGKMAERLISGGAGLVFKGSGFYITDYKRAGEKHSTTDGEAKPADAKPAAPKPAEAPPARGGKKKPDSGDK